MNSKMFGWIFIATLWVVGYSIIYLLEKRHPSAKLLP